MVKRVVDYAPMRMSEWIIGRGWDQNDWTAQEEMATFPDRAKLDSLFPNTPVYLTRIDGHAALVNGKALELAGITPQTKVEGGMVEVINGRCTGILIDKASTLVEAVMPARSEEEKRKALLAAQQACFAYGLTTVDEAGLLHSEVELIRKMQQSQELKMRVYAMLSDTPENFEYYIRHGIDTTSKKLTVRSFKFYADGALGSRGACLLSPYEDLLNESGRREYGMMLSSESHFREKAAILNGLGFQMNTHAIGDSANRVMLHIYRDVLRGTNDKRWRIEHAQVVHQEDVALFSQYNIIPSVQTTHATSDMPWAWLRLGKTRVARAYIYKELLGQNGLVALGTDFPVEGISPFATFYSAVVRKDKTGQPEGGFQMENALTREEALRGMTIWNAVANFEEGFKGSLEVGKVADVVILSQDIMKCDERHLLEVGVDYTVLGGEVVYVKP
jgi:predicted amidohydrolase YtcJ